MVMSHILAETPRRVILRTLLILSPYCLSLIDTHLWRKPAESRLDLHGLTLDMAQEHRKPVKVVVTRHPPSFHSPEVRVTVASEHAGMCAHRLLVLTRPTSGISRRRPTGMGRRVPSFRTLFALLESIDLMDGLSFSCRVL